MIYEALPKAEKDIKDLVLFDNVLITYSLKEEVVAEFRLSNKVTVSTRDWVGVYKAGWETYHECLTFEWGFGDQVGSDVARRRIAFHLGDLQSKADLNTNYQFVYITKDLEVLGVSQFFQFTNHLVSKTRTSDGLRPISWSCSSHISHSTPRSSLEGERVDSKSSKVTPVASSCRIKIPSDFDKIYTSCSQCKSLSDFIESHRQLCAKLQDYTDRNEELSRRIAKLEEMLEALVQPPPKPWDDLLLQTDFQRFVDNILGSAEHAVGFLSTRQEGSASKQKAIMNEIPFDSSRELMMKAIIGKQEVKIQDLTRVICQLGVLKGPQSEIVKVRSIPEAQTAEVLLIDEDPPEKSSAEMESSVD